MNTLELTLIPRITDKSFGLSKTRVYVFSVPKAANKNDIASAVAKQYEVGVDDVNIIVSKGKVKNYVHKGRSGKATRPNVKKAYVTLSEGFSIKMFEEEQ